MELNPLVFPAPKPSYNALEKGLIWIPTKIGSRMKLEHEQSFSKGVKVKATATNSLTPVSSVQQEIPCLLLGEENIQNGLILYFHANAEDIGMSKDLGKALV
jgi:abhydrolase domain-containing protein 17